jgi:Transposase IS4
MAMFFGWLRHARGSGKQDGPQGIDRAWIDQGFNATQAVVLTLMRRMENQGFGHAVWHDNLFTSARLLKQLRDFGIGGAGTVRTTKPKREEKEIKSRDKANKIERSLKATCQSNQESSGYGSQSQPDGQEHDISQSQVTYGHSFIYFLLHG